MDYDVAYASTDDQVMRLTVRGLYGWGNTTTTATTPEPDLATGAPAVSADGLTVTVTLRSGVMWNTTPAREVTAADVARGIKRACNPTPVYFSGMTDFESTIAGLTAFCQGYPKAAVTDAAVMKKYVEDTSVPGIIASGQTLTLKLSHPAAWLEGAMTLAAFNPTPIEAENALPGSPGVYDHMYSDGPYEIAAYTPAKNIKFVRNPVWKASTDPLRKAYVNAINVDETGSQPTIFQQITTSSPSLGLTWDSLPPPADALNLLNQIKSGSPDVSLTPTYGSNPFLVFNTVSPNNGGALRKAAVRQALSYALDRTQLIKTQGGEEINPPLTHILPPGTDGAQDVPSDYNPYPYDPSRAKSVLAAAGFTASHPLTIKFLYTGTQGTTQLFENVQSQLSALGSVSVTGVKVDQADYLSKYLQATTPPTPAAKGVWDITSTGWSPDWYGNGTLTWFNPLFLSPGGFPTSSGANWGYFASPAVNTLIGTALAQQTEPQADVYWAKADEAVMQAAAVYPITAPDELAVHASYVHNAVFIPIFQQYDAANVWLSD
jgi:peptide/nickel transport system substrate-binding protein